MSMGDRSEQGMTALVEHVAEKVIGADEWAATTLFQRYKFKEMILPLLVAVVSVLDEEPHKAKRGDEVEQFIKRTRDGYGEGQPSYSDVIYDVLDSLLDDYRLHADTATPLSEEAHDG